MSEAFGNIQLRQLRTELTILGIVIGAFALTAIVPHDRGVAGVTDRIVRRGGRG